MPKPRVGGVSKNLNMGVFISPILSQVPGNSPQNCKVLTPEHQTICEKLLPLVQGCSRIFLNQIIGQHPLSPPQRRKLEVIRDRHLGNRGGEP